MNRDYSLTPNEKKEYMDCFLPHLQALRAKAEISQEDISVMIGVSRQTYGALERGKAEMTWNTFLALLSFFDYNKETHGMLHSSGAIHPGFIGKMNGGKDVEKTLDIRTVFGDKIDVIDKLDEQAFRAIKTVIMLEYARCTGASGEEVIKAFDGMKIEASARNEEINKTIGIIKRKRKQRGE